MATLLAHSPKCWNYRHMQLHPPQNTRINWTKTHKTCTWIPRIHEPQKRLLNWTYKAIYRSNVTSTKNSMVFFHKNKRKSLNLISDNAPPQKQTILFGFLSQDHAFSLCWTGTRSVVQDSLKLTSPLPPLGLQTGITMPSPDLEGLKTGASHFPISKHTTKLKQSYEFRQMVTQPIQSYKDQNS